MRRTAEESLAAFHYHQRSIVANRKGDRTTARLYLHIAKEEDKHYSEFQARLKVITKASTKGRA